MSINTKLIKIHLVDQQLINKSDAVRVTVLPGNVSKNKKYRNNSYILWVNNEKRYIINEGLTGKNSYKGYRLFKRYFSEIVCETIPLKIDDKQIVYLTEYFEGTSLQSLLNNKTISEEKYLKVCSQIQNLLDKSKIESTVAAADREFKRLLKNINAIEILESIDKKLLKYLIEPIIRDQIYNNTNYTRLTSGDFHGNNILLNDNGSYKLIDLEFASNSHFYLEDWIRLAHFSRPNIRKNIYNIHLSEQNNIYEIVFFIKQIILEHKVSTEYLFYKNWPEKVNRIVEIARISGFLPKGSIFDTVSLTGYKKKNSESVTWQVFWPVNNDYSEKNSIRGTAVFDETQEIDISIPFLSEFSRLRFDPFSDIGKITIYSIRFSNTRDKHEFQIDLNDMDHDGDVAKLGDEYFSIGNDPRFILPGLSHPVDHINISFRIEQSKDVYRKVLEILHKNISHERSKTRLLKNSDHSIKELKDENFQITEKYNKSITILESIRIENSRLCKNLEDKKKLLNKQEQQVLLLNSENDGLKKIAESNRDTVRLLEKKLSSQNMMISELEEQNGVLEKIVKEQNDKIVHQDKSIEEVLEQNASVLSDIDDLRERIRHKDSKIENHEEERELLSQNMKLKISELSKVTKEKNKLGKDILLIENELEKINIAVKEKNKEIENASIEINRLEEILKNEHEYVCGIYNIVKVYRHRVVGNMFKSLGNLSDVADLKKELKRLATILVDDNNDLLRKNKNVEQLLFRTRNFLFRGEGEKQKLKQELRYSRHSFLDIESKYNVIDDLNSFLNAKVEEQKREIKLLEDKILDIQKSSRNYRLAYKKIDENYKAITNSGSYHVLKFLKMI